MSKHLTLALLAALVLSPAGATRAATPAPSCGVRSDCGGLDGVWWQHLPPNARLPVVRGMIASFAYGADLGRFNAISSYLTAYGQLPETKASAAFFKGVRNPPEELTFSKSAAAYVAAIDRFYKTYPSKTELNVASVLRCLCDKPMYSCEVVGNFQNGLLPWPTGP